MWALGYRKKSRFWTNRDEGIGIRVGPRFAQKGTGKRMELLRYVRRNSVVSIRALAKALGREHSNVHADVKALASAGLLDASKKGVRAEYDVIESRIAI